MKINSIVILLSIFMLAACGNAKQEQLASINASIKGMCQDSDKALDLYGPSVQSRLILITMGISIFRSILS